MSTTFHLGCIVLLSGALVCTAARADEIIDPSTLHIGSGAGTPCAEGTGNGTSGCPIFTTNTKINGVNLKGELNNLPSTGLDIYQNSGGAPALDNPVLLILAVPNNSMTPTVSAVSLYAPYNPADPNSPPTSSISFQFDPSYDVNGSKGYAGPMTSGVQDIYQFLGLPGPTNSSNSFTNWSAADSAIDVPVNDFGIYVYSLDTSNFEGNDLLNIQFAGNGIPEGTFAVAFGEIVTTNTKNKKTTTTTTIYDTPFTEAGLVDSPPRQVPEPSTDALFGGLLVTLVLLRARRRIRTGVPPLEF